MASYHRIKISAQISTVSWGRQVIWKLAYVALKPFRHPWKSSYIFIIYIFLHPALSYSNPLQNFCIIILFSSCNYFFHFSIDVWPKNMPNCRSNTKWSWYVYGRCYFDVSERRLTSACMPRRLEPIKITLPTIILRRMVSKTRTRSIWVFLWTWSTNWKKRSNHLWRTRQKKFLG